MTVLKTEDYEHKVGDHTHSISIEVSDVSWKKPVTVNNKVRYINQPEYKVECLDLCDLEDQSCNTKATDTKHVGMEGALNKVFAFVENIDKDIYREFMKELGK